MRLWPEHYWSHLVRQASLNRVLRVPLMLVLSFLAGRAVLELAPSLLVPLGRLVKVKESFCTCPCQASFLFRTIGQLSKIVLSPEYLIIQLGVLYVEDFMWHFVQLI